MRVDKLVFRLTMASVAACLIGSAFGRAAGLRGRPLKDDSPVGARANAQPIILNILARLNLSPEQRAKVRDLVMANRKAAIDLRRGLQDGSISPADGQMKLRQMRDEYLKAIKAVLTPEQARQFAEALGVGR